jgi:hypothetical protein
MGISNTTLLYIRYVVILIHGIDKDRINAFQGEIKPFNWLELSEN